MTGVRRGKGTFTFFFKKEARGKMMPEGLPRKVKEQGQEAGEAWGNFEKGELRSGAVETTGQHRTSKKREQGQEARGHAAQRREARPGGRKGQRATSDKGNMRQGGR